ncbi:group II intron maturase-specific domain-containing protein [Marinobacter sp. Arc7-DN-1]|uniref:group II intron maturase-specific domain-containing protein n=1 Tax=Marinobacter sp. Arc7-DN-1 TaxID=2304594 RepID=UPI0039B6E9EE
MRLTINESKSAVASAFGRKFLGYALWQTRDGDVRRAVSAKALQAFKWRIRQLTRRNGGRSIEQVVEQLRSYLLGWKGYFRLAQTPRIWRSLDEWLRRRPKSLASQTVEAGQDHLPGTAAPWRESLGCGISGGPEPSLVA